MGKTLNRFKDSLGEWLHHSDKKQNMQIVLTRKMAEELLKEQETRVMALDELTEIYVEFKGNNCPVRLTNFDLQKIVKYAVDGDCRLWTGKPKDEQRQAVKWE